MTTGIFDSNNREGGGVDHQQHGDDGYGPMWRNDQRAKGCICDLQQHASWCTAARYETTDRLEDWVGDAICGDVDMHELDVAEQRVVCSQCPVIRQCLDYALESKPTSTEQLWGGATKYELRAIRALGPAHKNKHLAKLAAERANDEEGEVAS